MTLRQVADEVGITRQAVWKAVTRGDLPAQFVAEYRRGFWYVRRSDLDPG